MLRRALIAAVALSLGFGASTSCSPGSDTSFTLPHSGSDSPDAGSGGPGSGSGASSGEGLDDNQDRRCVPRTCADVGATCGQVADGCGGLTEDCGSCTAPDFCGGGGPSQCGGGVSCTPTTCEAEGKDCGFLADGCGDVVDCGSCTAPGETCGAGGEANVCSLPTDDPNQCAALTTCEAEGVTCGSIGNGCGGILDCNPPDGPACPAGQTCGGGGVPGQCGAPTCTPITCADVDPATCGVVSDGCGGLLTDCGVTCEAPETCGGGGVPSRCGQGTTCTPQTESEACPGKCGPLSDGCDGLVDCGGCAAPDFCGGGGVPSQCGAPVCQPYTCEQLNATCGDQPDGCDGTLDCGTCTVPGETCGGGGVPSQCGAPVCVPKTCEELGVGCGQTGDGCIEVLNCGACPDGQACGGVPSQCAPVCTPLTCADVGANCGPVSDGCGGLTENCGTCTAPEICGGGGVPSQCGGGDPGGGGECTGLCEHQVVCGSGGSTTLRGVVTTPNGELPLYNALVYVPNAPLPAIADGLSCQRCEDEELGSPLVATITNPDGTFELPNVPANIEFPLVVKMGKWRRAVQIPAVTPCTTVDLSIDQARLPRNQGEGNIPRMAISTGRVDALECVLHKAGVDTSEFTRPGGSGRIHLYRANGSWPDQDAQTCSNSCGCGIWSGACSGLFGSCSLFNCGSSCCNSACAACGGTQNVAARDALQAAIAAQRLYEDQAVLDSYDMVAFGCEAEEQSRSSANRTRLREYVNKGGRLFLSHFNYDWIRTGSYNTDPLHTTAVWGGGSGRGNLSDPTAALVDGTFPKGMAFTEWLDVVNASHPTLGTGNIRINEPRVYVQNTTDLSRRWIYTTQPQHGHNSIQHFTFNTPVGSTEDNMCGRVVYTAFHVTTGSHNNAWFPSHCSGALTAQEKVLLFMLFDLAACVSDDEAPPPPPPSCTPRTCDSVGAECGYIADGCGGAVDCGPCVAPDSCGGGGTPNVCGSSCRQRTCGEASANCGFVADGCGGVLYCGDCPEPSICGGSGTPNICGAPPCAPRTCESIGATCGAISDGCGGLTQCGNCPEGEFCGGGGIPNQCGEGSCSPQTCAQAGAQCGLIGDGCGGTVTCPPCPSPLTCGGSGIPNQCGGTTCTPQTCQQAGAECGPIGDGCGGVVQCGDCPSPQICGGGGVASQCGGSCVPRTCQQAGATCGFIGDGCGGILSCGVCPAGQTCGGGGVPGQCGSGPGCTPATCQAGQCGNLGDGCGGIIDCGTCPAGQTCGGGGVANQCGTGTGGCAPKTCAEQGANCGPVADGCGGLLDCGVCPGGQTCGGGGVASQCGGGVH
jgi:hypothetical protein